MNISLFLIDGIYNFKLPSQVSGSFSFDSEETDIKLINIEEKEGQWFLYATTYVSILDNEGKIVDELPIMDNTFYRLKRDDKIYLMYVSSVIDTKMNCYAYNEKMKFIIGNTDDCQLKYSCNYLNNLKIGIAYSNNSIIGQKSNNTLIYINNEPIVNKNFNIKYGDELNIYGLRIIFLKNMLFINNLKNLSINYNQSNIFEKNILSSDEIKEIEIKDRELYSKNDYASKAPRIRRIIEEKVIKLSAPPSISKEEELPLILVIGPMFTMAIISVTTLVNAISRIAAGSATLGTSWMQILSGLAMLLSCLLWPILTKKYNKKLKEERKKLIIEKYSEYLDEKAKELENESQYQRIVLNENLITVDQCIENIKTKNINFWSKRIDQNDFLVVRIGMGNEKLNARIDYPEGGFSIDENELKNKADEIVKKYKYIENVPIAYSLYENPITAIMGSEVKTVNFINNILIQLLSFYSYEDLKIVVFTDEKNENYWDYLRYLNHSFTNDKSFRFFSADYESSKNISEYLNYIVNYRIENNNSSSKKNDTKPHFIVLVDDYDTVKRYDFFKTLTESDDNLGFSILIAENRLNKLPSKCNNFITLNEKQSGILKNSYEKQEQIIFNDEIKYDIDLMELSRIISNVPIEFEEGMKSLPNSITFLEMEQVGKVEQLNILNRWKINDSTSSLRAEVGIDESGDLMYLDLHEKFHGPHGLIAGMTGSGKSEFIITYILSMCINYSPDDVSFILIDYKGGGLAFAFENKTSGVVLPHLAGTITNLDKAEMDRTLVSIDSEIKRRQKIFNEARDVLGESTIDIYKYQKFYKEGSLEEPMPHLFIICDEFAELKSQQPDFMDNLISVARIGRSLGVHLILATQKPSGVVNDQIWSNTKFRVCLKVQDESDSREMLKRTEAAYLKQAGRFYLQVGYDEYFALGQSGWCGAKYYPSNEIIKQVDKSINFIDCSGTIIKSIQASGGIKVEPQGEQLANIMNSIIEVSNQVNKKARKLWLDNIPEIIISDELEKKYNYSVEKYKVTAIIGEYDAPEKQEQGIVIYDFLKDGNTLIYGNDGSEREKLLDEIIYSSVKNFSVEELNYYIVDYGSELFRKYSNLPHLGGLVFLSDEEKFNNLFKMIKKEINNRKKLFADYGGEYANYISKAENKLPLKVIILNNYDSIYENNGNVYEELPDMIRDSERYGIIFIITGNASNSIHNRISQNCHNVYAFKLKEQSDYTTILGQKTKIIPREIMGRGLMVNDGVHEFQVATIFDSEDSNDMLLQFVDELNKVNTSKADKIPTLPEIVNLEVISSYIDSLKNIPVGIERASLDASTIDVISTPGVIIASNKIENTNCFAKSFIELLTKYNNSFFAILDAENSLDMKNSINDNFGSVLDNLIESIEKLKETNEKKTGFIVINGVDKFVSKVNDNNKLAKLTNLLKEYENIRMVIIDAYAKIKKFAFEAWFTALFNINYGIWIGRGLSDQNLFHISNISREMSKDYKNYMGYVVNEGYATLVKLLDFINTEEQGDSDEG